MKGRASTSSLGVTIVEDYIVNYATPLEQCQLFYNLKRRGDPLTNILISYMMWPEWGIWCKNFDKGLDLVHVCVKRYVSLQLQSHEWYEILYENDNYTKHYKIPHVNACYFAYVPEGLIIGEEEEVLHPIRLEHLMVKGFEWNDPNQFYRDIVCTTRFIAPIVLEAMKKEKEGKKKQHPTIQQRTTTWWEWFYSLFTKLKTSF